MEQIAYVSSVALRADAQQSASTYSEPVAAKVAPLATKNFSTMVVIPARDEAADVVDIVQRVLRAGFRVVVIDDYSSDRTPELARAAGAAVLELPFHAGAWAAIQTGLCYALAQDCNRVVTLDADGQHDPETIPALIAELDKPNPPSVVIGSCIHRANRRRTVAWRVLRWLSGLQVDDLTSGFRVYDRSAMEVLASQHHSLLEYQDVGVLLCLRANGLRTLEKSVTMHTRRHGQSRIFSSWPMVAYYLLYSALIGGSRRVRRDRPQR